MSDFCKTLPKWGSEFESGKEYNTDKDIFVTDLVNAYEKKKKIKRMCRNKTVFTMNGMKENEYYTIHIPFNDITKAKLEKKYKGRGLVLLNETI